MRFLRKTLHNTASEQPSHEFFLEPIRPSAVVFSERNMSKLKKEYTMLGWALTFLVVALIAGALGFGGIAGASAGIAQILFVIFLILFLVAIVARAVRGKPPV